jgi:hypothetical protein
MMDPATNSLTPRSERPARTSNLHHSFTFETPSGPVYSTRKRRTKSFAMGYDGAADEVPVEKGGHTLRKRSRVDYTQELVDDDLLGNEPKPDGSKKAAHTPTTQARKRRATQDLSGDETDSVSVTQKRRRVDKESTPRSASTRRKREVSWQPVTSAQPSIDHPSSDNEVQDTILVGGAMETPDSSSDDKQDTSQAESSQSPVLSRSLPQLLTEAPDVQEPAPDSEETPALASENQSFTNGIKDEQLPTATALYITDYSGDRDATKDSNDEAVIQASAPSTQSSNSSHGIPVNGSMPSDELPALKQESHGPTSRPQDENVPDVASSSFIKTKDEGRQALNSKDEGDQEPKLPVSSTPTGSLEPHVPQPKQLPQLHSIYESAQQQVYRPPLAPYQDAEVIHPASWTEQVYPHETLENGISTPAPTITPRPSPPPKEPAYISNSWDPTKTLTHKQFFALYHQDALRRRSKGQDRISLMEFRSACARRRQEALENPKPVPEVIKKPAKSKAKAKGKGKSKRGRTPDSSVDAESPAALDAQLQQTIAGPVDETPRASPAPESQPATAAPSPEPEAEPEVDNQQDIDQDADGEAIETEADNGPVGPETVTKHPKKQYLFKKLADIGPMEQALEDPEEADDKTLYQTLESGAKSLKTWQDEYLELKKITDDEDNAKRRAQNDKAIDNWDWKQKLDDIPAFRRTFDDVVQKAPAPFDVKGVRAPRPYVDDPVQEHQRQEDKIMAQAYGFDYKPDKASIGKQDPIGQRWETSENRLRDRRQTQKAADAAEEGVILEGKRTRKPRVLEDHSAPVSRATTPVPAPRQRLRKTVAIAATEDARPEVAEAVPEPVTRKRVPRGKAKIAAQEEAPQPDISQNGISEEGPQEEKSKVTRKRARTTGPHPLATATYPEPPEEPTVTEEPEPPVKRQRKTRESANNGPEIPAGSFYSQPPTDEARRPSTASSSGTANTAATVESSYSLRDKRKRNFAAENDPIAETRPKRAKPNPPIAAEEKSQEPPKKKRVRNRKKAPMADENSVPSTPLLAPSGTASPAPLPGMMMHTFSAHPDPVPAPAKKALPKIKLINGYNGHPATVPAPLPQPSAAPSPVLTPTPTDRPGTNPGSTSGSAEPPEKPYSEMSKSEKMSYSMRRKLLPSPPCLFDEHLLTVSTGRWAAGEMQGAVEKRKNTLARKAEAKATAPPPDLTPKPLQPAAGPPVPPLIGGQPQILFQEAYPPPPPPGRM